MNRLVLHVTDEEKAILEEHLEWALRRQVGYYEGEDHVGFADHSGGGIVADVSPFQDFGPVITALLNGLVRGRAREGVA